MGFELAEMERGQDLEVTVGSSVNKATQHASVVKRANCAGDDYKGIEDRIADIIPHVDLMWVPSLRKDITAGKGTGEDNQVDEGFGAPFLRGMAAKSWAFQFSKEAAKGGHDGAS